VVVSTPALSACALSVILGMIAAGAE
jgi:hypothetical protein